MVKSRIGKLGGKRRPDWHVVLLFLPLMLVAAWGAWAEVEHVREAQTQTAQDAQRAASSYAQGIATRLDTQFVVLQFAAASLRESSPDLSRPNPAAVLPLRRFLAQHKASFAFDILSSNGDRILWSTRAQSNRPIASGNAFTPFAPNPDLLLGPGRASSRVGAHVLLMRFHVPGNAARPGYLVGSPYRLDGLLAQAQASRPWTFAVRDLRNAGLLGIWQQGRVRFADAPSTGDGVRADIPGYPFAVIASWPTALPLKVYWQKAQGRLAFELGTMLLLALAAGKIAQMMREQRHQSALRDTLLDNAMVGIVLATDRHFVQTNRCFATMLGYADPMGLQGRPVAMVYASLEDDDRVRSAYPALLSQGSVFIPGVQIRRLDGGTIVCDLAGKIVEDGHTPDLPTTVWAFLDVTDRHVLQDRLERLATHDALTGLPNRFALEQRLPLALARARRHGTLVAVGLIDLDDFKPVNDIWGHESGDALLKELARRLQVRLRQTDLLARLGGDEFIVIIEDLDEPQVTQQLTQALMRLHQAVEDPFDIAPGQSATIGMTMGVALFPRDAQDADSLIRQADMAMYQSKAHKRDRTHWWQLSSDGDERSVRERPFEPYGDDATALLDRMQSVLQTISTRFAEEFYGRLARAPAPAAVLANLSPQEMQALKASQAEHLQFLLAPRTTHEAIIARARRAGQVHALVGVDSATLVQSLSLHRELLQAKLSATTITARTRYQLLQAAEQRVHDDMQTQLQSLDKTVEQYHSALAADLPRRGALWAEVIRVELDALAALPGILNAAIEIPDGQGIFQLTGTAGLHSDAIQAIVRQSHDRPCLDPSAPSGQALVSSAWRSRSVLSSAAYGQDSRFAVWHAPMQPLGVRSAVALSILGEGGHPIAALRMFGAYPNQFESFWMRQFVRALRRRWEEIWRRCHGPADSQALPLVEAQIYRQRLFAGGLAMFMQPVVDLATGSVQKVESLARLKLDDGPMVPPRVFLPLLSHAGLDRLFNLALKQSLETLNRWDTQGLHIDVAINLPPSSLLDVHCPQWIEDALRQHDIAPDRLTLELLETQSIDQQTQVDAISRLVRLGVKLAMDDLGSGYSSLKRLSALPFDVIKIDKDLLGEWRLAPLETVGLISTLIEMGRDLNRTVVVEGLEDVGMVEAAMVLGATTGQGYALARPMPADAIPDWIGQFRMPAVPGTIHTLLGALAHHWAVMHSRRLAQTLPLDHAQATLLFKEQGWQDTEAAAWNAQIHAGTDVANASHKLLQWLVARVKENRTP
ncbi:EAL domain-containing protein [Thiomonas sp. FB-Cd]|uniref:EAL domain-containing protein n=1 Tax=Thiomonas sp. FB-Cd TaxID=1158292 RepID=UPI00068BA1BD|nr:EAL domain-containing protein [Thiomonas sp. FB-Cd]